MPNFSAAEESILLTLVERFAHKIENKRTDAVSWEEKRKAWEEIAIKFESQTGVRRGPKNLREKYETLKKNTRKSLSEEKKEVYKTGGGKFDYRVDERTNRIAAILGQSATGLENDVDSDAKDTSEKEAENLDASMASGTAERLDESYEAKENDADWSSWNPTLLRSKTNEKLSTKRDKKKENSDAHQIFWLEENQRASERHTWAKTKQELEVKEMEMKMELLSLDIELKKQQFLAI